MQMTDTGDARHEFVRTIACCKMNSTKLKFKDDNTMQDFKEIFTRKLPLYYGQGVTGGDTKSYKLIKKVFDENKLAWPEHPTKLVNEHSSFTLDNSQTD